MSIVASAYATMRSTLVDRLEEALRDPSLRSAVKRAAISYACRELRRLGYHGAAYALQSAHPTPPPAPSFEDLDTVDARMA